MAVTVTGEHHPAQTRPSKFLPHQQTSQTPLEACQACCVATWLANRSVSSPVEISTDRAVRGSKRSFFYGIENTDTGITDTFNEPLRSPLAWSN